MAATNGNDTLDAIADGEIIDGGPGDDTLGSNFNNTTLIGGLGNDKLTTDLSGFNDWWTSVGAVEVGGLGDDQLNLTFDIGTSGNILTKLAGGEGNDSIDERGSVQFGNARFDIDGGNGQDTIFLSAYTSEFAGGGGATFSANIDGGGGNDQITSELDSYNYAGSNSDSNFINGGTGDDRITSRINTAVTFGSTNAESRIVAGYGDDYVEVTHDGGPGSNALNTEAIYNGKIEISGGVGNDNLIATTDAYRHVYGVGPYPLIASLDAVTVDHTLGGGAGNDVIESLISAGDASSFLSASLDGGLGNDTLSARVEAGDFFNSNSSPWESP